MSRAAPPDLDAALDRVELEPTGSAARILGCAERLFAARGFDGVTTRDVATAAGVNVSTLHFHWSDKRTLYEAVCRLQGRQLLRLFERADPTGDQPDPLRPTDRIRRWVDRSIDLLIENPAIARLAWQSVSGQSAPDLPTLLQHDVAVFRRLQSEVVDVIGSGRSDDAALSVLLLFYFLIGVFSDSDVQRSVLEGSVHRDRDLQRRIRSFSRRLTGALLNEAPIAREEE